MNLKIHPSPLPHSRIVGQDLGNPRHLIAIFAAYVVMGDVKAGAGEEGGAPTTVRIKVRSQDGDSVQYDVKPSIKLTKVRSFRTAVWMGNAGTAHELLRCPPRGSSTFCCHGLASIEAKACLRFVAMH